jgi:HAD superfamily 5'-nucleotidase-like hydrolase
VNYVFSDAESRQLVLPLPGVADAAPSGVGIPRAGRVFVNRNLRMSSIEWVGFDMDYTVAIYNQAELDALSVELTLANMVQRGYPSYLKRLSYDTRFPIRGLLIDKRYGHILKMDRYKVVHKGYHGMQRLSREAIVELYHHKRIRPHTPRYHWIDTLFALSEVTSYAAIVGALEQKGERIDYDKLFSDVRASIDEAHRDGTFYSVVLGDRARFVERDPELARTLHKLRSAGKKLFLLTNSPWSYTDQMLTYLLGTAMHEYPSWRHYFDVIVVGAQKPLWFKEGRPFMERDGELLRAVRGSFEHGKIYEGGNLRDFERMVGLIGSSVLYVGDHIYGDMLRSKKESSWRTAMIIQELDAEIAAHEACAQDMARQRELEESRDRLEDELRFYQARFKELTRAAETNGADTQAEKVRTKRALERVRAALRNVDREWNVLDDRVDHRFHPYWGSLLKEENEMSMFGLQVDTYSDIYTRRVSCLEAYSPQQYYRSPYDLMPHEL